jgi:DNA polymerase III alpha subunit
VEHGFQSNYYIPYELVENHNNKLKKQLEQKEITKEEYNKRSLKFIFGAEAYWVKDRKKEYPNGIDEKTGEPKYSKDRTNCHIILLAKNEEGRRDINEALSDANIDGYYGQPRVDLELLLRIKPENVFVTTACLKYWAYQDIEEITVKLHNHFKDNFYFEIQCHNTQIQKDINKRILILSKKYGIDIIFGYDSHYIYEEDATERNNYLEGRGIKYDESEAGWYMDYPDDETVVKRLKEQGALNDEDIKRCMSNTDKLLEFEDLHFNKDIKLPSLYKGKTQEWKNNKLRTLVYEAWEKEKRYIDSSRYKEYEEGIEYELTAIIDTGMADYFLIDYEIVKMGIKNGGIVTKTGRGSGVSYYVNSLLGFSNIDRFISPVRLYPDRFMSKTRILQTKSLPDLDLNLGNPEVFADAQKEILGENHAYPMISYKPLQKSSAFKLYAKSQKLDFEIANEVTSQIKQYEKDLKHADSPEDKEAINLYDYVDEIYHKYLDESKKYQGIINAKSQAPCGYLIYDGDIKREIGLIKCKSESTHKEVITTVIDGMVAENYKFVKNDLLKVDVWLTINKAFEKIGIPTYTVPEITKIVANDEKTWKIYENGYTLGVNQCESNFGKQCCKRYKPQNMQELTALVSALRPGFKTQLDNFLDRKPFTSGIKELDLLLEDSFHYIMYQENIMTYLGWLGIEQTETYEIIKKISKKKFKEKELTELKSRLIAKWYENTGKEEGFEDTWKIVEAFAKYAFNASHAYSYAYDSVYGAYLKAHYPYEFYSVMLQSLSEKGDKDKVAAYKVEMKEAFGISEGKYKFRKDNRIFSIDKEIGCINPSIVSIKNFSQSVADELYSLKDCNCDNFVDLLLMFKENTSIGFSRLEDLIKIDYFSEFGNIKKLLKILQVFIKVYDTSKKTFKKQISKEKTNSYGVTEELVKTFSHKETDKTYMMVDMYGMLKELSNLGFSDVSVFEKIRYQHDVLNAIDIIDKKQKGIAYVLSVDTKYAPKIECYALANGNSIEVKIDRRTFNKIPLKEKDLIFIKNIVPKERQVMGNDGEYHSIAGTKVWWITDYRKASMLDIAK